MKKGYIALTTVLIVGMVASVIMVSLLALGLGYSRSSNTSNLSMQARSLSNACTEEALRQTRLVNTYTATNVTLSLSGGSCIYTVTNTGGNTRQIDATATVQTVVRKVRVTTSALSPKIVISSWQEIQ